MKISKIELTTEEQLFKKVCKNTIINLNCLYLPPEKKIKFYEILNSESQNLFSTKDSLKRGIIILNKLNKLIVRYFRAYNFFLTNFEDIEKKMSNKVFKSAEIANILNISIDEVRRISSLNTLSDIRLINDEEYKDLGRDYLESFLRGIYNK